MSEYQPRGLGRRFNQRFVSFTIVIPLLAAFAQPDNLRSHRAEAASIDVNEAVAGGLDWLAANQSRRGNWTANEGRYPTAMTALAGTALLLEGSTPTQGKHADSIAQAVDYLISRSRPNGLIGDPKTDDRYTYGHGFSMLFLSQVLGEEEDLARRSELIKVLEQAVEFSGRAQTKDGGWGYVSAKDGNDFDEGSTTITQVQGLRGCRNAGIPVPRETSTVLLRISTSAQCQMVAYNTAQREEGDGQQSRQRLLRAYSTLANTMIRMFRVCWLMQRSI